MSSIRNCGIAVLLCVVAVAMTRAAAAQETYKVGDRVEWNIGDIWYKGTVYNVEGGRFQIDRDGYGRAREMVNPSDLRRLGGAAVPPAAQPANPAETPTRPAATGSRDATATEGGFVLGDRVEWNIGDTWFAGTIYGVQPGQYRVNRDGYGRATEWTNAVRPLTQRAEAAVTGAGVGAPFRNGERVEVNVAGNWVRGNVGIGDPSSDRYVIDRENPAGNMPRDQVVTSAQVRRLTPVADKSPRARLPESIPEGVYECQLYLANSATVGRLRILPGGAYTGLSTSGTGQQGRYAYDAATGKIDWAGGLQGFSYPLQASALESNGGAPFITIHYRLREGGSINSMSCVRA